MMEQRTFDLSKMPLLVLLALLTWGHGLAGDPNVVTNAEGKAALDKVLGRMEDAVLKAPYNAFRMDVRMKATNTVGTQDLKIVMHMEKERVFMEAEHFRYYSDAELRLAVIPSEQEVYVYDNADPTIQREEVNNMLLWRRSLLFESTVTEARWKQDPKLGKLMVVRLKPSSDMEWAGVKSMTWTILPEKERLLAVRIEYVPGRILNALEVDYDLFIPGRRDPRATRTLQTVFLTDVKNSPLKGFTVQDHRLPRTP